MSEYGVFSGPYFPIFRLNTGKMWENTGQKNSVFGHFLRSDCHLQKRNDFPLGEEEGACSLKTLLQVSTKQSKGF